MKKNSVFRRDRMAERRRQLGLSQEALAALLDVPQPQIGGYEAGLRQPSLETLIKLARELRCTTDWLVDLSEEPELGRFLDRDQSRVLDLFNIKRDELIDSVVNEEVTKLPNVIRDRLLRIIARLKKDLGGSAEE